MELIQLIGNLKDQICKADNLDIFFTLEDELSKALLIYWEKSGEILKGSGVELFEPPDGYSTLENNFFSALFLYSYYRAGIKRERRILYSAMNQCLRGMVTGCDNLLDDEYKRTLETSLPEKGVKFRSVLDIMVSDRVLFDLSLGAFKEKEDVIASSTMSLRALIESGYQEATEEGGITEILPSDRVLETIHHYKTGILFNCPWAIPSIIEDVDKAKTETLNKALYNIGMGCQIMDDMADLKLDMKTEHHNYVVSLIYHDPDPEYWEYLKSAVLAKGNSSEDSDILMHLKEVRKKATETAREYLTKGLTNLFEERHKMLVEPTINFLSMRIGVSKYFLD